MTCKELTDFLDEYLAGGLPGRVRVSFRFHLALCRSCRIYLRTYRNTIHAARAALGAPGLPVSGAVPEALVEAILKARAQERHGSAKTP